MEKNLDTLLEPRVLNTPVLKHLCSSCGILKDRSEFYKDRNRKNGMCPACKKCTIEQHTRTYKNRIASFDQKNTPVDNMCDSCGETKKCSDFVADKSRKIGIKNTCKECHYKQGRERTLRRRSNLAPIVPNISSTHTMKICIRCKEEKPLSNFYNSFEYTDGFRHTCKACMREDTNSPEFRKKRNEYQKTEHRKDIRKRMLKDARKRARQNGLEFSISITDIVVPETCPIFGIPLIVGGGDNSPSLDRINPKLGYVPGNVKVVSLRANHIKNNGTVEEHEAIVGYMKTFSSIKAEHASEQKNTIILTSIIDRLKYKPNIDELVSINNRLNWMREFTIEPISQHRNSVG
jgi:hypothetical protein